MDQSSSTPDPQLVKPLSILVDTGEAEAIALAQTMPDCIILLDDSRARRVAERLQIKQIGTVGLLLRAKRKGLIDKLRPLQNATFFCQARKAKILTAGIH